MQTMQSNYKIHNTRLHHSRLSHFEILSSTAAATYI